MLSPTKHTLVFTALIVAVAALVASVSAGAAITSCTGSGVTSSDVIYGVCNTDQTGGAGSVSFTDGGLTAAMSARTQRGPQQVAMFWESNGPVAATEQICVSVRASQLNLKGAGSVSGYLALSWDGAPRSVTSTIIDSPDNDVEICGSVPAGASDVWWQLQVVAGGDKPSSQAQAVVSLTNVRIG
jgi:hypothetical protein